MCGREYARRMTDQEHEKRVGDLLLARTSEGWWQVYIGPSSSAVLGRIRPLDDGRWEAWIGGESPGTADTVELVAQQFFQAPSENR